MVASVLLHGCKNYALNGADRRIIVRFQVLTDVGLKTISLLMDAGRTSETSVRFSETTRRCVSEGCHLQEEN